MLVAQEAFVALKRGLGTTYHFCQLHVFLFVHSLLEPWVRVSFSARCPANKLLGGRLDCSPLLASWVSFIARVAFMFGGMLQ